MRKLIGLGLLVLAPILAAAQSTTSAIVGEVRGPGGVVLPGAEVSARHVASGASRTATSDENGGFTLPGLPVGEYEVRAELQGFQSVVQSGIALVLGQPAVLTLTLGVGAAEDEITVTGDVSGIQTRSGELSFLVTEAQIRELPLNGRNYTDLVFLQPGVIAFP